MFSSRTLLQAASILPFLYSTASAQTACNNSPSLCDKAYNNITHLGAHDSPFLRDASTSFSTSGNQYYDTTTQLDAGVRLLSAQVHQQNSTSGSSEWHLCHSSCDLLDAGTLAAWLGTIKTWMDSNPNDVVTILLVNSDNASPSDLGSQFKSSGIDKYAYTPPFTTATSTQWPTLSSLISNNTRLITFVASLPTPSSSTDYPYLLNEFTHVFENGFEVTSPSNYSCTPDRPSGLTTATALSSGRMFLSNHFLEQDQLLGIQSPNDTYANVTNAQTGLGSLGASIAECEGVYNRAPTFVLVDFFNVGPAVASVDAVNGVANSTTGRKSVSTEALDDSTTSGVGGRRTSVVAVVVAVVVGVAFSL
ncbi:hypothetical protein K491DRAFT_707559 [Lophiostoma macrostomum CBS 122681]|uniref:PLC-like phosphodiesterase n=1 Tax=Lophiostoma macrostomum CBS 122681 TaxID=1314788 RepID=A0A6A6SS32_9PLEO|nr:hypothetical protein K491DRAFT_707559 [Lophiostoma macrostomum CBS 122681]